MKQVDRTFLPRDGFFPFEGLSTFEPATQLKPSLSPVFTNCVPNKGLVSKRHGYTPLGSALNGVPLALINFQTSAGVEFLVCITTTREYKYNTGTASWDNITAAAGDRTGSEDDIVNWTVATGSQGTWLIITNGKDKPRYWSGAGNFDLLENAAGWSFTNFKTCKSLAMFYNHLVLMNITYNASTAPFDIFWGDKDSLVSFTTGTAGNIRVSDSKGTLEQCVVLGDRLIIYAMDSIGTFTFVGGDAIFLFEELIQDTRLLSPRAIVNLGPFHLLMRKETISVYDGTRALHDIGDRIFRQYRSQLDLSSRLHAFAFLDRSKNNVYFATPITPAGSNLTIFYMVEYDPYDVTQLKWCRLEFSGRVTAMGFYTRDISLTWDAAALSGVHWNEINFTWDAASINKGFPVVVLGLSDGTVQLFDDTRPSDAGAAITAIWESPDYVADSFESTLARWTEIELGLRGEDVNIYISTDKGSNWTFVKNLVLTGDFARYVVNIDVVSITLRVMIQNFSATSWFEANWRRVWFREQGAR